MAMRRLAAAALQVVRDRVAGHRGSNDLPMAAYSDRGPIYVPIYGKGGGGTKTQRGGTFGFSAKEARRMGKSSARGRRTAKFENYAAMKRSMGKSGARDLELSGRMLGSIGVTAVTDNSVTLGFLRETEHEKALGNEERTPWWGLSPRDEASVIRQAERILKIGLDVS